MQSYDNNKKKIEYDKQRYLKKRNGILKNAKNYYALHKKEKKFYSKKYRDKNKNKISIFQKIYHKQNNEKLSIYRKKWYQKNKKTYNYKRKIILHNNIKEKIRKSLSGRIYKVLKRGDKSKTTMELLGCSIEFLKQYLQIKFQKGMTFKNYGKWHIDHIIPCVRFDLSKLKNQKKCFHYTNLQPLWAIDNLKKGTKLI